MTEDFQAVVKGFLVICVGALGFMFKKHYERVDARLGDHDSRLNELEKEVPVLATKDDIDDLRDRLDANIDTLRREMSMQHRALLEALVKDQR